MINTSNDSHSDANTMRNILHTLMQISFPYIFIVSIVGICGNFVTIIMLSKRSLSKNFNNCTLIALALTDLIFNLTLVSRCIHDITQSNGEQLCRLLSFISHLAELLSACFTAHFTAQRFIAVRFPLSVFMEKKVHLIHYLIVLICIIFSTIYCLALVEYNAYDGCHEELELKWFISDALLSFVIPLAIITVLNILIIMHLKKGFQNNQQYRFTKHTSKSVELLPLNFQKKTSSSYTLTATTSFQGKFYENIIGSNTRNLFPRTSITNEGQSMNGRVRSIDLLYRPSSIHSKSQSYRVTRMLIVVSTCFLLLNAPAHICTIGLKIYTLNEIISNDNSHEILQQSTEINYQQYNQSLNHIDSNSRKILNENQSIDSDNHNTNSLKWIQLFYIITIITQHISYASYSINFFLYSFCGMKFRRELVRCMSNQRRQLPMSRSITVQNI